MNLDSVKLIKFNDDWSPMHWPPKKDGFYNTIRCGLSGIYTHLDEWKDGKWHLGITDGSDVIAYSKEQITKEEIQKWYEAIKEKVNKKYANT